MTNRTQFSRTNKIKKIDPLAIENKDPKFDYSFQRRKTIEDGGGATFDGWEPVSGLNHKGEQWDGPKILKHRGGAKQFLNQDTILCKRPKEVTEYYKSGEIEKRNNQIRFVNNAAKQARKRLREIDPSSVLKDNSKGLPQEYTQKTGPTEEE